MLLLLRKLKHGNFMKKKHKKYLAYALGEMLLVIIGILIALEIDNWNADRQQQELLESYLQSIARNIREDAGELERLRTARLERTLNSMRSNMLLGRIDYAYNVNEIFFFNKLTVGASENLYFRADTSGYEALKNSGVMGRLQGQDAERLLSQYYDRVSHVEDFEDRLNELLNALNLQFVMSYPDNITQWWFWAPRAIPPEQFQELLPDFAQVINGPAVREMVNLQMEASGIILEYDRLVELGEAFVGMVESGSLALDDAERAAILESDVIRPDRYAEVVVDGRISSQFYNVSGVAEGFEQVFDYRFLTDVGDGLRINYPGSESWAAVFTQVIGFEEDRAVLDFSQFDKLVIEARAESGSETIEVHIKDSFLPDTEAPDIVELRLTGDWQTYEIDLARFPRTDLANLISPLGFSFDREPRSFSIRNARYVDSE
jgi:hypothetical protein